MILIKNLRERNGVELSGYDVYIGRYNPKYDLKESPLANQIRLADESQRDSVLTQYKRWLWGKMQDPNSEQTQELRRIGRLSNQGTVTLWCWCAPKPCHGDIVRNAVEWMSKPYAEKIN